MAPVETDTVILWLREERGAFYGVAEHRGALAATLVAREPDEALGILMGCLPPGAPSRRGEGPSGFADATARMLAAIESGDESGKRFELSSEYLPVPASTVYRLVAAIPLGYASTYGRVAEAAGTIARVVGRLMATNPLYPIVPCHRVVGSDYSLVGYRGKTCGPDIDDKLERLRSEARGFREELVLPFARPLAVFPVERIVEKADRERRGDGQLTLL